MFNDTLVSGLKLILCVGTLTAGCLLADTGSSPVQLYSYLLAAQPAPNDSSDRDQKPPRSVQRIGTAIPPPRNAVSIKSTDAGAIPRRAPVSGCTNCGMVNFVHQMTQGSGMNAIVSGVVAGTIAREVIGRLPPQAGHHPGYGGHFHDSHYGAGAVTPVHPYQAGVTMDDGRQVIIAIPEGSGLQQGDRVKWVDGVLVLDRAVGPDSR
ncbi:MAG: hypothetical protein LZF61_02970 [Nitrosomonas sp.]|nr:MAG: hypothetical protein LZF61_02970 [Nitrosomonas sp.]